MTGPATAKGLPTQPPAPARPGSDDIAALVADAVAGDRAAWDRLIHRYTPMVGHVARGYRLAEGDVEDVVQAVWMRCFQNLDRIRDPRALPGWLKTTAQNEALRVANARRRSEPIDPVDLERLLGDHVDADGTAQLLRDEADQVVRDGLAELTPEHRRLLLLLHHDSRPSYRDVSRVLGMPTGSIGPTRARCIAKLRQTRAVSRYVESTTLARTA